ncbi:hypothetical protein EUGRSUZ_E02826 [Eucalyptus grandis]|uniref:C3H1-type domain-containing protein n=2 Tax=Eucalyptus grandis TaxID=71139 RepID=A0A059C742_EUCGR|nr:hypothetical protein EUGRSUZ_E02826 [Eucalyptus grandis]
MGIMDGDSYAFSYRSIVPYSVRVIAPTSPGICTFWLEGRCKRNPSGFCTRHLFHDGPGKGPESSAVNSANSSSRKGGDSSIEKNPQTPQEKVCRYWISGNCVKGDACPFLHSWFQGVGFAMLAKLEGHKKGVSGIALPSGSTMLYSGSKDGTVRIWDCHTGQCVQVINLRGEVGCFTCEGPWLFVGMPNTVKAWNIQNGPSYDISGLVGQVHTMEVGNNMLFAGAEDGTILVWKGGSEADPFQMTAPLRGHTRGVVSLTVGRDRLYSGSIDQTIRVWDLHTLECVQELVGHTDYLISCSSDQTVKVWGATEGGSLEVVYAHHEDHGILALSGMSDGGGKPVLLCACIDNTVRLYELPSFTERGKIFSRREIRTLQTAPGGLFFTGDAAGMLTVWNWLDFPKSQQQLPHSMESC